MRGFTLIEILISIALLGVMVVLYQLVLSDSALIRMSKNQEIALRVATNKIEDLRDGGYASIPATGTFSDTQLASLPSGVGNLTVTAFNAGTKQVVVAVTWREPAISATQTISLSSLITNIGGL